MNNPFRHQVIVKGKKENIPKDVDVSRFILPPGPVIFETKKQYVHKLIHNQETLHRATKSEWDAELRAWD